MLNSFCPHKNSHKLLIWCLLFKEEEITTRSPRKFMSLFCSRQECLLGNCHQLLTPRNLMQKIVTCD